jgi:hypothetical protein
LADVPYLCRADTVVTLVLPVSSGADLRLESVICPYGKDVRFRFARRHLCWGASTNRKVKSNLALPNTFQQSNTFQ